MTIAGTVALVTGAGTGLGQAIAQALLARGAALAAHVCKSEEGARRLADSASPGQVAIFRADLRDPSALDSLVEDAWRRFGAIDILVNNASVLVRTPVEALTAATWDEVLALNLRAPALLACSVGMRMRDRGRGVVVNIGDLAGIHPWPAYLAHASAKAGLHHLTRCLARALAPRVRVNAVAPGLVEPPPSWSPERIERFRRRIPLGMPTPEQVGTAVLSLIENDAITGQIFVVDGGQSLSS